LRFDGTATAAAPPRSTSSLQNPRQRARPRCFAGEPPVTDFSGQPAAASVGWAREVFRVSERAIPPVAPKEIKPMSHPTDLMVATRKIEAYREREHARIGTLPRHFGRYMLTVEGKIYDLMREFSSDYEGGYWHFYELSNGGFYMAPPPETLRLCIRSNRFDGQMTADGAGITVCLFAFSLLSFEHQGAETFNRHFHRLRDFALGHAESVQIFAAID